MDRDARIGEEVVERILDARPGRPALGDGWDGVADVVAAVRTIYGHGPGPRPNAELSAWWADDPDGAVAEVGARRSHRFRLAGVAAVALLVVGALGAAGALSWPVRAAVAALGGGSGSDPAVAPDPRPDDEAVAQAEVSQVVSEARIGDFVVAMEGWTACMVEHAGRPDAGTICGDVPNPADFGLTTLADAAAALAADTQAEVVWMEDFGGALRDWSECVHGALGTAIGSWQTAGGSLRLDLEATCGPVPDPADFRTGTPTGGWPEDLTLPVITLPDSTVPDVPIPDVTIPDLPDVTVPDVSVPTSPFP